MLSQQTRHALARFVNGGAKDNYSMVKVVFRLNKAVKRFILLRPSARQKVGRSTLTKNIITVAVKPSIN